MRKSKLPIVRDCFVEDSPEIRIGSDAWFDWLSKLNSSFRYEPIQYGKHPFTVVSRVRKGSGTVFWVGVRKVDGKVRQEYLGLTEELDYERLQLACDALSLDARGYQKYKANKDNDSNTNTFNSQVSKDKELEELKTENEQLKTENEQNKTKYEQMKNRILELKPKLETKEHPKFDGIKGFRANGASGLINELKDIIKSFEK